MNDSRWSNLIRALNRPSSQLARNSTFATGQSLIALVCLFGAYQVLTSYAGIEAVGLWSLLVAGSLMARSGDISGVGALSRFVAQQRADRTGGRVAEYVHTVLLTSFAINLIIGGVFYVASFYVIRRFVEPAFVDEARRLVPYTIVGSICLAPLALGISSAVDGVDRADKRAVIISLSSVLLLIGTWLLVPSLGVIGFGMAQIGQQLIVIVISWFVLRDHVPEIGLFPLQWQKSVFLKTIAFGLKVQANGLASVLSEPLAKFLLNQWGGLAAVGYYEFAARLVFQMKGLVVAAAQPLIASFSSLAYDDTERLHELLVKSTRIVLLAAIGVAVGPIIISPFLSRFLFGGFTVDWLLMVCALAFGASINAVSVPFYYAAFGNGIMRWNILAQVQMACSVLALGIPLGLAYGTYGVVTSIVTGHVIGGVIVICGNAHTLSMLPAIRKLLWPSLAALLAIVGLTIGGAAGFSWVIPGLGLQ